LIPRRASWPRDRNPRPSRSRRRFGSSPAHPRSTSSGCARRTASPCCSNYAILTERYATPVARIRETFEPVLLHAREATLLEQPRRAPALLVEGVAFGADDAPIELSRTYVRGDRTRYYLERNVVVGDPGRAYQPRHAPALSGH
jgi:hypothetical protein